MSMVGDIKLKIEAILDTKQSKKELEQTAATAKSSIDKSMTELTKGISRAIKMAQDDVSRINSNGSIEDVFKRAADAIQVFNERGKEIRSMDVIDANTAKLYKLELELNRVAKSILNVQDDWDKLTKVGSLEKALQVNYGSVEEAEKRVEFLRNEISKLTTQTSGANYTPEIFASLYDQSKAIEETRNQLKALYAERKALESRADRGGSEWEKEMQNINAIIPKLTQQLGTMSNAFYAMGRREGLGQTKQDINEMLAKMTQLTNATAEYRAALRAVQEVRTSKIYEGTTMDSLVSTTAEFEKLIGQMQKLASASTTSGAVASTQQIAANARHAADNYGHLRAEIRAGERMLAQFYTISVDVARGARQIADVYRRIWSLLTGVVGVVKRFRDSITATRKLHITSWKEMLRNVIKYAFGIRTLFALFRRLRRYIKEAFEEMAKQVPEVNKTLSELKSSLGMLKGSLATAFEPIISAVAPLLNILIEKLSQAMTYIGMFFAALTGRGYVYQATKSMQNFTKETKKAKDQLQKFDELNNITTNKNKDDDEAPIAIFKKVPVPDWIKDLADKIKNIINQIIGPIKKAWALVGEYVKWAWLRAFNAVKKFLLDIGKDFLRAWEKWGTPIFIRIFQIVGDIGETIANLADALDEAWNANDNGYKIWNAILEIIYKITSGIRLITKDIRDWAFTLDLTPAMTAIREWLESLIPVVEMLMGVLFDLWNHALKPILNWTFNGKNSGIARFFNILRNFNNMLNKSKIRQNLDKIWKALGKFGQKVGEGLLLFMDKMLRYLGDWLNSDDFTKWCENVAEFLDSLDPEELADDLMTVVRIVKNLAKAIWDAIQFIIDHKDTILKTLEWASKHIKGIVITLAGFKLGIDLVRFGADLVRFVSFFKDAKTLAVAAQGGTAVAEAFSGPLLGQATAIGTSFATTLAAGFMAAWGGLEVGRWIGEGLGKILGDEDMVALYEQYDGITGKVQLLKDTIEALRGELELEAEAFDKWKNGGDEVRIMNQNLSREIREGLIPTEDDLRDRLEGTGARTSVVNDNIDDLTQKVYDANPQLQALVTNVENAGIAMDSLDSITQVAYGLDYFRNSGNDAAATSQYLAEKFGFVDEQAQWFFTELQSGNQAYVDAAAGYEQYVSTMDSQTNVLVDTVNKSIDEGLPSYEEMMGHGENITEGLSQGMQIGLDGIGLAVGPGFTNIISLVEDIFKIHSPSKVMEDIGINIVQGLIKGITSMSTKLFSLFTTIIQSVGNMLSKLVTMASNAFSSIRAGMSSVSNMRIAMPRLTVPHLAQGAVIPPNKEFLAVLGDQKSGTNIESPLSTMVEAFNQAGGNRSEQELTLLQEQNQLLRQLIEKEWSISASQMFNAMQRQAVVYTKQSGKPAFS